MAISGYEMVTVQSDFITVDLIVWRRYRMVTNGMVEELIDANPHIARIHRRTPFLPVGTQVRVPIDTNILRGMPKARANVDVFGRVIGGLLP